MHVKFKTNEQINTYIWTYVPKIGSRPNCIKASAIGDLKIDENRCKQTLASLP